MGWLRRYTQNVRKRLWPVVAIAAVLTFGAILTGYAVFHRNAPDLAPPPACVDGPITPGIDVSYYQGAIKWPRVREAGIRFAFIRISDGLSVRDTMFATNWPAAKRAHVLRGVYQHFRPDEDATKQADLAIAAVERDPGELPPVLDVEVTGGRSPKQVARAVRAWVDRIRTHLHVEPIIYTSPDFWRDAVGGADFSAQPLWVAHYTTECPRVPAPWVEWSFWQHSETGQVPGISGPVDLDVMRGEL